MKLVELNTANVKAIYGRVNVFLKIVGLSQSAYGSRVASGDWFIAEDGHLFQRKERLVPTREMVIKELSAIAEKLEAREDQEGFCFPSGSVTFRGALVPHTIILKCLTGCDGGPIGAEPHMKFGTVSECAKRIRAEVARLVREGK